MEIKLTDLLRVIKKRSLLITVFACASVILTAWVSYYVLKPQYTASAILVVQPQYLENQINYNDLAAKEKFVPTMEIIAKSRKTASDVVNRLKLDITEEELLKRVEVGGIRNSLAIKITVTCADPSTAAEIANAFASSSSDSFHDVIQVKNVVVLDEAKINPNPVSPKPYFNMAVAFFLALNTSIGLVVLSEIMDKTIRSPETLAALLNVPVLATFGRFPRRRKNKEAFLACLTEFRSSNAEEFRRLRTNIRYMRTDRKIQTLLITSALPKEGKSFVAANLAVVMAQEGKRVLLIDGDLRKPEFGRIFNVTNYKGLTNVLNKEIDPRDAVFRTNQPNLYLIPSGPIPANPSDLLGTVGMKKLIQNFREEYDFIVIDTAPLIPVTDALELVELADGVILVNRLYETSSQDLLRSQKLLQQVGANLIGTVGNFVKGIKNYNLYHNKASVNREVNQIDFKQGGAIWLTMK